MTVAALGVSPYEWIVNSNALGVAFVSKEKGFRVAFLSRHAVRRLADRSLLGCSAEELLDEPARSLADVAELSEARLANPGNYPAVARTEVNGRHLELAISSVTGGEDQYLGVMITFKDVTVDVEREDASNRFKDLMAGHASSGRSEADRTELVAASEVERILKTIDVDSQNAYNCTTKVVDSVASLIATQRAMDQEVQAQG
jgi:hypothetical protein